MVTEKRQLERPPALFLTIASMLISLVCLACCCLVLTKTTLNLRIQTGILYGDDDKIILAAMVLIVAAFIQLFFCLYVIIKKHQFSNFVAWNGVHGLIFCLSFISFLMSSSYSEVTLIVPGSVLNWIFCLMSPLIFYNCGQISQSHSPSRPPSKTSKTKLSLANQPDVVKSCWQEGMTL